MFLEKKLDLAQQTARKENRQTVVNVTFAQT